MVSRLQRVALSKLRIIFTNSKVSNLVLHYIVNYQLNLVSVLSASAKLWNGSCLIFYILSFNLDIILFSSSFDIFLVL